MDTVTDPVPDPVPDSAPGLVEGIRMLGGEIKFAVDPIELFPAPGVR